jgi:hypothetical protein
MSTQELLFELNPLGQMTYVLPLASPKIKGDYILKAMANPVNGPVSEPTVSRRKVKVE